MRLEERRIKRKRRKMINTRSWGSRGREKAEGKMYKINKETNKTAGKFKRQVNTKALEKITQLINEKKKKYQTGKKEEK